MPMLTRVVSPGPEVGTVRFADGTVAAYPTGWELVPPGDAALTRRLKAGGPAWTIQEKKGRRTFSQGVLAAADRVVAIRAELETERATETYAKRRVADTTRRERKQTEYVEDFQQAVVNFLNFAPLHAELAEKVATAVAQHATPVGSGTVARTQRIPIERRAEAAVIAWLRHQTTEYDDMQIARRKGERRAVRQQLAAQSRELLRRYRNGETIPSGECPLSAALAQCRPVAPRQESQ